MSKNQNKHGEQYLRALFRKCETDEGGTVYIETLLNELQRDEEVPPRMVKKLAIYFNSHSSTGENKISFRQFIRIMDTNVIRNHLNRFVKLIVPPRKRTFYGPVGRRARSSLSVETDGAYDDEYCFWPPQMGMILITITQVIFFIIDETTDSDDLKIGTGKMAEWFIYDPLKKKEVWRFLTYMFVHVGYAHIIMNAVVQLIVGFPLESVHKWWRVLIIYFLGVIAGSLLTSVLDPNVHLAGASGGVYAIITAHIAAVIMNFKDMSYGFIHLGIMLTVITVDVGSVIYNRYTKQLDQTVGYAAHFAGALAGLLVGIWVVRNVDPTTKEKYLWWSALVIYVILMAVLIVLTILL
ncbi:hypothetical protein GWI33_021705 [Rhynchophorus ferrugineus]|uniref:Peptidase S54 rhomboid domain-containing protein n=1 Tax=Rhynchophorus ferrugineus TaxID=354439 RepID=A0A834ITD9_RHYFE|nr:hypothetical protein GWI33_021705 [Rhynchophorus ferrugineus]